MSSRKFNYEYNAPTAEERLEIENIKNRYVQQNSKVSPLEQLRRLNKRVTLPPLILSWVIGVAGVLIMGLGMSMSLVWNLLAWGSAVGVAGIAIAAVAYPVYKRLLNRNKMRYGEQIIKLSNELLNEPDEQK